MRPIETHNALIKSTSLGYEDHGMLTFFLHLEWHGAGVGFGGYALDTYDAKSERRIATAYAGAVIANILRVVGVDKWEDLQGKYVRVKETGLGGRAVALGNILKDEWFDPAELADQMRGPGDRIY